MFASSKEGQTAKCKSLEGLNLKDFSSPGIVGWPFLNDRNGGTTLQPSLIR